MNNENERFDYGSTMPVQPEQPAPVINLDGSYHGRPVSSYGDPVQGSYRAPSPEYPDTTRFEAPAVQQAAKSGGSKSGFFRTVCFALALMLLCSGAGAAGAYAVISRSGEKASSSTSSGGKTPAVHHYTSSAAVTGESLTPAEIYDIACSQVVGINISITSTNIFGQTTSAAVSGTGFIITEDGYIITNYHVIEYSALKGYEIKVMLYDGSSYTAEIIGFDSENDIAVIKIDTTGLSPAVIGKSSEIGVGDDVFAVGNPLGELTYTMTSGMVSALDRCISTDENTSINMFQFDAAVNEGNSGGPVYNARGEVVGVVTAKYKSAGVEGLSFAVPIDDAVKISDQLIEYGYVTGRAYLGVVVKDLGSSAAMYGVPAGVYVNSTSPGSAAENAGVLPGDIITAIGGHKTESIAELTSVLRSYFSAGDVSVISVFREGRLLELSVTFDEYVPE